MIIGTTKKVLINLIIIKIFKEIKIITIITNRTIIITIREKNLILSSTGKISKTTCRTTLIVSKGHQGKDRELPTKLKNIGMKIKNKLMNRGKFRPTWLKLKMYKESKPNIGKT